MNIHAFKVCILIYDLSGLGVFRLPDFIEVVMECSPKLRVDHVVVGCQEDVVWTLGKVECLSQGHVGDRNSSHFLGAVDKVSVFICFLIGLVETWIRVPPAAIEIHANFHGRH
jgi:hypothetical protein